MHSTLTTSVDNCLSAIRDVQTAIIAKVDGNYYMYIIIFVRRYYGMKDGIVLYSVLHVLCITHGTVLYRILHDTIYNRRYRVVPCPVQYTYNRRYRLVRGTARYTRKITEKHINYK